MSIKYIETPIGIVELKSNQNNLAGLSVVNQKGIDIDIEPVLLEAEKQIHEYFAGTRKKFELDLYLSGTEFQLKVFQAVLKIPYGMSASYSDISNAIGNPKSMRAVGMANHKNPLPIIIPCHRVIGKNGSLTGYVFGVDVKKYVLDLEKSFDSVSS